VPGIRGRLALYGALGLAALGAGGAAVRGLMPAESPVPVAPAVSRIEAAPLCPWREPEADLRALFPGATGYVTETRVVSGQRLELARALGRPPAAEENALHLYRVRAGSRELGTVLVRRVKGRYGAVEVVVGVEPEGKVRGVRLQRLREPEPAARALRSPTFLGAFRGKSAEEWPREQPVRGLPEAARPTGEAVAEGVRSLLVLLRTAERRGLPDPSGAPHH